MMVFCPECGERLREDTVYCPKCGHRMGRRRSSLYGLDRLLDDTGAQGMWISRFIAYLIDSLLVGVAVTAAAALFLVPFVLGSIFSEGAVTWDSFWDFSFYMGLAQILYFTVMEGWYGASVGKQFLGLRVETLDGGRPDVITAFLRNLSKLHGGLLIIDVFGGILTSNNPEKKLSDSISSTRVVRRGAMFLIPGFRTGRRYAQSHVEAPRRDPLEGVGFGVFLITVAVIALSFPGIHLEAIDWLSSWVDTGPTSIPANLMLPLIWFLAAMGVWELLAAVIKLVSGFGAGHIVGEVSGAMFTLGVAYLLREYMLGTIAWKVLLSGSIILLGTSILLTAASNSLSEGG